MSERTIPAAGLEKHRIVVKPSRMSGCRRHQEIDSSFSRQFST